MVKFLFSSFLLAVVLVANNYQTTTARIFDREQHDESKLICIKHCQPDNEFNDKKFIKFETGQSYVYAVKVTNEMLAKINKTQTNGILEDNLIQIDGQARLESINSCEVSMQLENVNIRLSSTDSFSSFRDDEIELYERQLQIPIIFSYKDGIVTEICSPEHEQEDPFVINVKKSIISALQTISHIDSNKNDQTVVETDYHGKCDTDYHVNENGEGRFSVLKRKNLLKCSNLEDSDEFSEIGFAIKESREAYSECEQQIESYRVIQSECRSSRSLDTMFNHFDIDLISRVHLQQVSIDENSKGVRRNKSILTKGNKQQWLRDIFRLEKTPSTKSSFSMEKVELKTVLHEICDDIKQNSNRVGMNTVDYVQQLIRAFEYESVETIQSIWNEQINVIDEHKSFCGDQMKKLRDIFIDTAASIMHEKTATIIRDELLRLYSVRNENPMATERLKYLATSMAFAQNPSLVAIQQVVPQLLDQIHDSEIVLSVSALIKSPTNQQQNQDYTRFKEEMYKKIVNIIMKNIKNQTAEVQNVRLFIALENVSPWTMVEEQEQLLPVIENSDWSDLIRVVAIKSFDAVQPTPRTRQSLMKIFSNFEESNEIRIISYRTLIRTGTNVEELQQILNVIEKEQQSSNRHVYNYVCSHQKVSRNTVNKAKRSSLPSGAPEFPEPSSLMQVFLSRHYEYDYVDQKTGLGSFFETDVIMPNVNETFKIPRSITMNVTIPLGKTDRQIAVAEVTVRQEGFEGSMSEKILSNIQNTLSKHRLDSQLVGQLDSIVKSIKNIFLYDSDDRENHLSDIWKQLQKRLPIRIDETMIILPWQKRIVIDQTSSGVPMYFEINSTYIGSLEAMINYQNQSSNVMDGSMELMLKPTFVAHTEVGFGIEGRKQMMNQFRIVSQILAAPTLHLQTEIKQAKKLQVKFLLPEKEQVWWKSLTKIIKNQSSNNVRSNNELTLETKCTSDMITKVLGISLCRKTKKASLLSKQNEMNEMLIDYNEIILRKQTEKMQGIEFSVELPEHFFAPMLLPEDESRMKFQFSIATPMVDRSEQQKRFETELVIELPIKQSDDQLSAKFVIHAFKRKLEARFELVDGSEQKSFVCEIVNERNQKLVHVSVDGQVQSDESDSWKDAKFNVKAVFQPTENMKLIDSNGMITYQKQQDGQQKAMIKFDFNDQTSVDMVINRNGQTKNGPLKISTETKMKIYEFQAKHEWFFVKDSKQIKSMNKIHYNRLSNWNQFETFNIEYESNGYDYHLPSIMDNDDDSVNLKQYFHYRFLSSQYPSLNLDVSYNQQQQPDLFDNEFVCKFGKNMELNQFRLERTTRKIHNVHDRESMRLDTQIQVQFTPKNIHYVLNAVTDVTKQGEQRKITTNQVKIEDKRQQLSLVDFNLRSEKTLSKPFRLDRVAEIKFYRLKFHVSYNETIEEIANGKYHGKIELVSVPEPGSNVLPKWTLERLQYQYKLESDINEYEGLMHLISNVRKFESQAFFENELLGHCGQMFLFHLQDKYMGNFQLKNVMRREGELMYELNMDHQHDEQDNCECNFQFKTELYDNLKIGAHMKQNTQNNLLSGKFEAEKSDYKLETSVEMNENLLDVSSLVKKQDQTIYLFHGSYDKQNHLNVQSECEFFTLNVEYEHLNRQNESTGMIKFQIPKFEIKHQSRFQLNEQSQLKIDTQTRYHGRNWMEFSFKTQSNRMSNFVGEFSGDLHGQIKIEQVAPNVYQLMVNIKAPRQQISHQTKAKWQHYPNSMTYMDCCELIAFDMKNYFGEQFMFDIDYNRNEPNSQQKYANELMISTRSSHVELSWSPKKALVVMKTKLFNGIDHRTEFEEFDLPLLKFVSKTKQNNQQLIQLIGDLMFKNGQKSSMEIIVGDGNNVHMEFVPMKQLFTEFESSDKTFSGSLQWTRTAPKQWLMKINGQKQSSQFKIIVDHECQDHTDIEWESATIHGKLQHRLNDHSLKLDLTGEKNENFEHHSEARWNPNWQEFSLTSNTNKSGQKLFNLQTSFVARKSFQMNSESNLKKFPFKLNTLINVDNRHLDFDLHEKLQDHRIRFETKAKNLNDFRVQCGWGQSQDQTKKIAIETKIQPEQNKAKIEGQWFKHHLKCEGQLEKLEKILESPVKIEAQYSDLDENLIKLAKFEHEYKQQERQHDVLVECRDGQTRLLTGQAQLKTPKDRSMKFEMKTETDLNGDWDQMNTQTKYEHRSNEKKNFGQIFLLEIGSKNEKKSKIELKGKGDSKAIIYELNFNSPNTMVEKKAKLEWNKPERKLQINVYDKNGRIVDVNVDLFSKAVQKKFQIVSFTDNIPTIDVEAAFGDNSHLIFAVSYQKEKKLELVLNWFGKWRSDYRANIMFQCWAEPQFEMMIQSHHPATFDNVDVRFKYQNREIQAKWMDRFDDERHWQREATIQMDGHEIIHLNLDRIHRDDTQRPTAYEIVRYEGRLSGDYSGEGKAEIVMDKQTGQIKVLRIEGEEQSRNNQHYSVELYFRYQELKESPQITGLTIERNHGKPVLIATYVEPPPMLVQAQNRINTLVHLYLPGDIDYQLLNEIHYDQDNDEKPLNFQSIQQVKSKLLKKGSRNPILDMEVHYYDNKQQNQRQVRVELRSPKFYDQQHPKVLQMRYNFDSMNNGCEKSKNFIEVDEHREYECSSLQMIFGDEQTMLKQKSPVSIALEFVQRPSTMNHSLLFALETLNENDSSRVLNFTLFNHMSPVSIGSEWQNVNRYGRKHSGNIYFGYNQNHLNVSKFYDIIFGGDKNSYRIHFEPKNIRQSFVNVSFNVWQWLKSIFIHDSQQPKRIEELSERTDIGGFRNQMFEELKDEIRYKYRLFKRQIIDRELVILFVDEYQEIRHKMQTSDDHIARLIIQTLNKIGQYYEQLMDKYDLELIVDNMIAAFYRYAEKYEWKLFNMVEDCCFQHEQCRKLYRTIRDYEIHQLVRRNVQHYVPQTMLNVWNDFNQQQQQPNLVRLNEFYDQLQNGTLFKNNNVLNFVNDWTNKFSSMFNEQQHHQQQSENQNEQIKDQTTTTNDNGFYGSSNNHDENQNWWKFN
ncbi:hypothetical protein DERP_002828 [Dermatophagoides pteronyssinus]|uniref:Vitellogenin domain-containing protein n=1 Tax=Dermatophagoides pteronyssinus TaxID=6956 RepID=A0ABQ8JVT7_DERPT|nr:hypothetical protein DERP_002828 [Dermatophagoides pteronyssinus]